MAKYRNATSHRLTLSQVGVVVDPGETFETDRVIEDANFELVIDEPVTKERTWTRSS